MVQGYVQVARVVVVHGNCRWQLPTGIPLVASTFLESRDIDDRDHNKLASKHLTGK